MNKIKTIYVISDWETHGIRVTEAIPARDGTVIIPITARFDLKGVGGTYWTLLLGHSCFLTEAEAIDAVKSEIVAMVRAERIRHAQRIDKLIALTPPKVKKMMRKSKGHKIFLENGRSTAEYFTPKKPKSNRKR